MYSKTIEEGKRSSGNGKKGIGYWASGIGTYFPLISQIDADKCI